MLAVNPGLAQERAKPKDAGTDESRVTAGLLFLITLAVAGFSVGHCRQAFNTPPPIRHLALGVFLLSGAFQTWAMIVNPFFSPVVRLQTERGHRVIADGPYRFMRHPGYLAMMIYLPASALSIGSWLALIPASCFVLTMLRRVPEPTRSIVTLIVVGSLRIGGGYCATLGKNSPGSHRSRRAIL